MPLLSPFLDGYDQLIIDLDGCVWVGDEPVEGSPEAVASLRAAGKRLAFATNNSWHAGEDHVAKLWSMGIRASLADVVTVGGAIQHLLAETRSGRSAYVVGTPALHRHVEEAGLRVVNGTDLATRAEVVVVGGTDRLTYDDIRSAALAARRGADLLGCARDPTLPMPEGPWPGTGATLAAIETASGREAEIVGKPAPRIFETALDRLGEGRTLVIGDRVDSDVAGAAAAGIDAALVLTGDGDGARAAAEGARAAAEGGDADPRPVRVADSLGALVNGG